MLKRLTQWTHREGMTRDEALAYWEDEHAPLVRRVPGVLRYVQNHCIASPVGEEPPYTGSGVWLGLKAGDQRGPELVESLDRK